MLEPRVLETRLSLKKHTTKLQNISEYNVKITFFLFPPCYVLFKKRQDILFLVVCKKEVKDGVSLIYYIYLCGKIMMILGEYLNSRQILTKGLSGNALKVIAIVAMTIDYLAWVGVETYEQAETPLQIFLHIIGRLTAPMMIFFVAEGYYHTHNFQRYLLRLAILAVVSHFAFCYFNMPGFRSYRRCWLP